MKETAQARPLAVLAWPAFSGRSRNPYTSTLYRHLEPLGVSVRDLTVRSALARRPDLLHVHWPERAFASPRWHRAALLTGAVLALLALCRRRGTRVVWTVHNLEGHDRRHPRLAAALWRAFLRSVDGLIALTQTGLDQLLERHPSLADRNRFVIPHGHFRGAYGDRVGRETARGILGLSGGGPVLLCFGQIRPYKNVPSLIRAFRDLDDPQAVLLVAGRPASPEDRRGVVEAAACDPRVRLALELIAEDDVQLYLRSADLVVLPYSRILHSGAAMLALSFDRPVLLPRLGAMEELARTVGERWVATYDGPLTAAVLGEAAAWARRGPRAERAPLEAFAWPAIAQATLDAYRSVLARGSSRSLRSKSRHPGSARALT